MKSLKLRTLNKAAEETGVSRSFFKLLLKEGRLTRYGINSSVYISLKEFEKLATQEQASQSKG
jgi:hypothetical protein